MPHVTDLRPGDPQAIAGYRIVGRLGAGGQGVVYLATTPTRERVAIKQLRFGPKDDRARQQFVKEVAAARLVAPFCTAQVLDAQLEGPAPYVVSEYIEGDSLQQRIERRGPMTGAAVHRLAIGTATALAAIHQAGVVHRDFKPANVMLAADGPRVIDFGIARDLTTDTTVTSRIFGTPAYMAPEQLRGESVGPATDMFAWASVIAYAATGHAPFEAPHMVAVMHRISNDEPDLIGVPADLAPVLSRCLNKDPSRRPTAQQALALLLGRSVPEHDVSDPTQVLAEATGLLHAAALENGSPTVAVPPPNPGPPPGRGGGPGQTRAFTSGQGSGRGQGPGPGQAPARRPNSVPVLAIAAALLIVVLGGTWVVTQSGLFDQTANGTPSPSPTAGAGGPTQSRPTEAPDTGEPAAPTTPAPTTPDASESDTSGNGDENGDENEPTVPEDFDGSWEGNGFQPSANVKNWRVEIKLRDGETTGRMKLPDFDCAGDLTVLSASDQVLLLAVKEKQDRQNQCADAARIQITLTDSDNATFLWQDDNDATNQATGDLSKK